MERIAMNQAFRQAVRALGRFPLVIAFALAGTVAALWLNHLPLTQVEERTVAGNLVMTCWLGVSFLFALALAAESLRWPAWGAYALQAAGAAALAAFYYTLLTTPYPVRLSRFWLCMVAAHLCASLGAALGRGATVESFWRFNQRLAARLGLSLGYFSLIYIGLSVALASVKTLLEVKIPDAWFLDPAFVALGVINTWFFLSGVPPVNEPPQTPLFPYPRQLRILTQLILMPLVCVYLIIIYAYAIRTLTIWAWPTGWVSYLLLCFCALGLVCLALIQPLAERGGNRWATAYSKHFHIALFPVLILLFAAIGKRVQEYGITENRYIVLALGVWLGGIVLHSALGAPRDLRVFPASLCLVALLASFGPWGAFEVSRKSQVQRLKGLLESQGMLVGGKLAKAPGRIPRRVAREIGGIADYLEERERLGDLKGWIPVLDDSGETHSVAWHKALDGKFALLEALELPYMPPEATGPGRAETVAFSCRTLTSPVRKVSGFDYLYADYHTFSGGLDEEPAEEPFGAADGPHEEGFWFSFDSTAGFLRFHARDTLGPALDVGAHFQKLRDRYPDAYALNLPEEEMLLDGEDKLMRVLVKLRHLRGEADAEGARLKGFSADVFIELKGRFRARPRAVVVPRNPTPGPSVIKATPAPPPEVP